LENQLLRYVQDQIGRGVKPDLLKARLVRQGYSPALVEGVIDSVNLNKASQPLLIGQSHEKSSFSKILLLVFVLGIVLAGVFFIPGLLKPKEPLLDVRANSEKFTYAPGEDVGFTLEVFNMGSTERFDVTLLYRLLDVNENAIFSKEETAAVSTSTSFHKSITLPSTIKPGTYVVKIFANYEGKVATTSFSFDVAEKTAAPTCQDNIKNQDETNVDCGGKCGGYWYDNSCHSSPKTDGGTTVETQQPSCNDKIQNQDETNVDCGGVCGGYWYDGSCHSVPKPTPIIAAPSFAAIMMQASETAKTNPEEAKNTCLGLETTEEKDKCLKKIADVSVTKDYCALIESVSDKDECYYPFFMRGDYSVCEQLTNAQSRKSCEDLRDIEAITSQLNQSE